MERTPDDAGGSWGGEAVLQVEEDGTRHRQLGHGPLHRSCTGPQTKEAALPDQDISRAGQGDGDCGSLRTG